MLNFRRHSGLFIRTNARQTSHSMSRMSCNKRSSCSIESLNSISSCSKISWSIELYSSRWNVSRTHQNRVAQYIMKLRLSTISAHLPRTLRSSLHRDNMWPPPCALLYLCAVVLWFWVNFPSCTIDPSHEALWAKPRPPQMWFNSHSYIMPIVTTWPHFFAQPAHRASPLFFK